MVTSSEAVTKTVERAVGCFAVMRSVHSKGSSNQSTHRYPTLLLRVSCKTFVPVVPHWTWPFGSQFLFFFFFFAFGAYRKRAPLVSGCRNLLTREYKRTGALYGQQSHHGTAAYQSLHAVDPSESGPPTIVSGFCCSIASSSIFCRSRACCEPDVDS